MIAVDTNLLVYAHRSGCPEHEGARRAIEEAAGSADNWGIPAACVFEFWSVVTHPASSGGASRPSAARGFIQGLLQSAGAVLLPPPAALVPRCLQLAEQLNICGPRIFDLQISLTALESGVDELWTHDAGFVGLPGLQIRDPLAPRPPRRQRGAGR
ncbi:MAG TPA: PIN domain-containing protein [Spirochaetia bacterium]|nr:PIN domain-containing protein [Spirochaetia bacterium]